MRAEEILETCLYVDDLDAAESFYGGVLGLDLYAKKEGRHLFFRCGRRMLLIFDPHATLEAGSSSEIPPHGSVGEGHLAFAVSEQRIDRWVGRLGEHGVEVESRVTWPNGATSLYFRDPADNSLELATPKLWELSEEEVLGDGP